ncbi:MAG: DegT/DnrJ/EryC1/StrS family aminotransferase [Burkholderiaceae bacterium]
MGPRRRGRRAVVHLRVDNQRETKLWKTPRFVDVRPDIAELDETRLEQVVGPRTRAIVPVHYAGVGCAMELILEIARVRGGIEDNARFLEVPRTVARNFGTLAADGAAR